MNKMASTIIPCIHSALDDVELLLKPPHFDCEQKKMFKILITKLRNLKTFVLSARKLANNESLGSFLVRIEDTVRRKAEEIHPDCLYWNGPSLRWHFTNGATVRWHFTRVSEFRKHIQSLETEIDEWYVAMLDCTPQSSSLTTDEVLEIVSSILENLVDFHSFRWTIPHLEALGEQMTLLKSLIHFITQWSVEPREDLLAHSEAIAINIAAYLFFSSQLHQEMCKGMQLKISTLLQKIKHIDPQDYETYARALSSPKLPRRALTPTQDIDDDILIAMKNFLDSLISKLWEMLRLNTCVVSVKDQLQELYEGLRSLRTILKQQANNFDMKIKEDIGAVLCDAGVLIFSFYHTNIEVDLGFRNLLETIKVILAKVGLKDPQRPPIINFSWINGLGFLDFLLEKLMELTSSEVEQTAKSRVQTIQEELGSLRSFLGKIIESRNEQEELQTLWDRVLEVAYRVECLIDHLVVGNIPDSFSTSFDSIIEDIGNIKENVLKILHRKRQEVEFKQVTRLYSHMPSRITPTITTEVVGFDNEARSIMDRLMRGSKQLRIVAIVGMPGQGKTTLATKVYNDPSILLYFSARAWCPVSQVVDKKKVLLDLSNQIDANRCSFEMTEQDLAEKLRRSLKGKRYLILLDDIWDIEAWKNLEGSFPDDFVGSRIILTSRLRDVAPPHMLDQEPHLLRELNKEESLELLQRKLFPENGWPSTLRDLGMQIVEKCKGLPLTIVIVAGLLTTIEPKSWKEILDGLSSSTVSSTEQCKNTLELSYKQLPDYLKPCLLYFGAFQEDQEVSVRRLLCLWIAEGFVGKDEKKRREDIAEDYLKDLINRSLIMVSQQRYDGGVKACRIHDLLHDFCLQKVKDEQFLHFLKGYDEVLAFNEPRGLRRLCIHSKAEHFKQSKLFCPRARSLLFNSSQDGANMLPNISFVIHIFKLLRVLDLEQIRLDSGFPGEIALLVQLAFLAIGGKMSYIPSSIAKLSNLETFILDPGDNILSLPDNFWNLRKLRYLYIRSHGYFFAGGVLPIGNLYSSSGLYELDRVFGAFIYWDRMERLMKKFPRIRQLKCRVFQHEKDAKEPDKIVAIEFLSQLESLRMSRFLTSPLPIRAEFSLPANLKKLTLAGFDLSWKNISSIGKLPKLEVLKLLDIPFEGRTLEMKEGEFSTLKILKLCSRYLVRWRACEDQFVCLQKLVLRGCEQLKEIPSCLEFIQTLEIIEVSRCPQSVVNLVKQIEEECVNLGNSDLKIITSQISKG